MNSRAKRRNFYRNIDERRFILGQGAAHLPRMRVLGQKIEERSIACRILIRLAFAYNRFAEYIDGESRTPFPDFAEIWKGGFAIRTGDKDMRHRKDISADEGCGYRRNQTANTQSALKESGDRRIGIFQIFREMFNDFVGRTKSRKNIDESKYLRFEKRIAHRPLHQPPREILFGKQASRTVVFVNELEYLPSELLDIRLNIRNVTHISAPSSKSLGLRRRSVGCFSRRERSAAICIITVERATRKNRQPAAARRVAFKMGRLLRCSSVTYRYRNAPSSRLADDPFVNTTKPK